MSEPELRRMVATLPNCLSGVHDGPKVVTPGDRLANGAGVSWR